MPNYSNFHNPSAGMTLAIDHETKTVGVRLKNEVMASGWSGAYTENSVIMTDVLLAGMFYYDGHTLGRMFHYKGETLHTGSFVLEEPQKTFSQFNNEESRA